MCVCVCARVGIRHSARRPPRVVHSFPSTRSPLLRVFSRSIRQFHLLFRALLKQRPPLPPPTPPRPPPRPLPQPDSACSLFPPSPSSPLGLLRSTHRDANASQCTTIYNAFGRFLCALHFGVPWRIVLSILAYRARACVRIQLAAAPVRAARFLIHRYAGCVFYVYFVARRRKRNAEYARVREARWAIGSRCVWLGLLRCSIRLAAGGDSDGDGNGGGCEQVFPRRVAPAVRFICVGRRGAAN